MGQTLINGIYLPSEGERNCYAGLAANWNAVDTLKGNYSLHAINVDIHVTATEKETWNGKADASALTAHTGNTTIHVTAEDKAKWDAVTSKANDSDVVHKSGDETISGVKTFAGIPVFTSFDGIRFRCIHNSNAYVTFRNANQANPGSIILSAHNGNVGTTIHLVNKALIPYSTNDMDLGIASRKWKSFNGLEPSALSMPDLSNGVDISSYIDVTQTSQYTAPANGYIAICGYASATNTILLKDHDYDFGITARAMLMGSNTFTTYLIIPVVKDHVYDIICNAVTTLSYAKFYPCQGNV